MTEPAFIVGIDLGTTNSAVAYVPVPVGEAPPDAVSLFEIHRP